jgi:hypothetical protein
MPKVLFALISAEALDGETCFIFDERLPFLEDCKDSFGRVVGNGICRTIARKVVSETVK